MPATLIEASHILNSTPVGITVFDIEINEITYANHSAAVMLGIPQKEINVERLRKVSDVIERDGTVTPPEKYATKLAAISKSQEGRIVGVRYKDDHVLWLDVRAVYGILDGREVVVTSFSDVTSIIEAQEREITILQNISHELRTPLAIIYGNLDLLAEGQMGELPPAAQAMVERLFYKSETLRLLVERALGVLTAEQKSAETFAPLDIGDLLEESCADFQVILRDIGRDLDVQVDNHLNGHQVNGDERLLWLVLNNVLTNAAKFTPEGKVSIHGSAANGRCLIKIEDTGIGIPQDQLDKIFDRLYQIDGSATRRYGGTGIGLHFAKLVVEAHGGQILVESQVGHGSVFSVEIPLWTSN